MREWVLNNTIINENEYDNFINSDTVNRIGERRKNNYNYTKALENPMYIINKFTYRKPTKLRCKIFKIENDEKYYIYKGIKFKILANHLPSLKRVLYSTKRIGTCVKHGLNICFNLENSKIVTAMCDNPLVMEEQKFLHTFVTYVFDEIVYVIDPTINVIMEKSIYLKLFRSRVITEISREKMINDINYLKSLNLEVTVQEYLCFPNEIMKGVENFFTESVNNLEQNYVQKRFVKKASIKKYNN